MTSSGVCKSPRELVFTYAAPLVLALVANWMKYRRKCNVQLTKIHGSYAREYSLSDLPKLYRKLEVACSGEAVDIM